MNLRKSFLFSNAARENILFNHRTVDRTLFGKDLAKFGEMNFVQGAEWQSKQSPWISVNERLPENEDMVFTLCKVKRSNNYFICVNNYIDGEWEAKALPIGYLSRLSMKYLKPTGMCLNELKRKEIEYEVYINYTYDSHDVIL